MRSPKVLSAVLVVAALTCGSALASAVTFGAEVYGAFNTHSMGDWNDAIDDANASGSDYDNVNNGFTGGIDARLWATPNWLITAGWEPIFLNTEDKSTGSEVKFNAQTFGATGNYFFPMAGKAKYGVGAGVGLITSAGEASGGGTSVDLEGNGVTFQFQGTGEWSVSPGFSVTGTAGYRIAKIDELKANGTTLETSPGNPIETDYSGLILRAGLAFYLPTK